MWRWDAPDKWWVPPLITVATILAIIIAGTLSVVITGR